ncbi:MAG: dual specificity protein phosphatase family protein [Candidatus Heimdallarchaeota archaeon]|nr:dual specificity protein phosphatase family protein [Candidatus Heimdallarchaeota archaeon]MCK5048093.1 dual specificity protein phosphatase family protein [Candidatus Heimdallarchaeota archaeon]
MKYNTALPNFSWVEEGIIAGASKPSTEEHFIFLKEKGIKAIINLREKIEYQASEELLANFEINHLPIIDFSVPSIEQVLEFRKICKKYHLEGKSVLVHCYAGCGRTGIMLAHWLLMEKKVNTTEEAIREIRRQRPCSIETLEQEESVKSVFKVIRERKSNET